MQDRPIMKTIPAVVSFLVVAASVLSSQAAKTLTSKSKGQSAYVRATSCSPNCGCSTLSIEASESSTRQKSTSFTSNNIDVYISTNDYCTGKFFSGIGYTTFGGFPNNWVKKGGSPFTLKLGVLDVCSFDGGGSIVKCQSVSGSVTITPNSDYTFTSNCRSTDSYSSPFFKSTTVYNSIRTATATATLNLSIDGVPTSFKDFDLDAGVKDSKTKEAVKSVTVPF
jgi:hypothetical protein